MKPEELIKLAEKYEKWAKEVPECMVREYKAIAEGLRMLANIMELGYASNKSNS